MKSAKTLGDLRRLLQRHNHLPDNTPLKFQFRAVLGDEQLEVGKIAVCGWHQTKCANFSVCGPSEMDEGTRHTYTKGSHSIVFRDRS